MLSSSPTLIRRLDGDQGYPLPPPSSWLSPGAGLQQCHSSQASVRPHCTGGSTSTASTLSEGGHHWTQMAWHWGTPHLPHFTWAQPYHQWGSPSPRTLICIQSAYLKALPTPLPHVQRCSTPLVGLFARPSTAFNHQAKAMQCRKIGTGGRPRQPHFSFTPRMSIFHNGCPFPVLSSQLQPSSSILHHWQSPLGGHFWTWVCPL